MAHSHHRNGPRDSIPAIRVGFASAMRRAAQFAFGFSLLLFCLLHFGISDFGQTLLRGRIPPNATHRELDEISWALV